MRSAEVSVIIPVWKNAQLAMKAAESAMLQTVKPREIIFIDDGSRDHTESELRSFASTHSDFNIAVLVSEQNNGPGSARNIGWDYAKGDIIAFLDADDFWHPNKLELQIAALQENPELDMIATLVECDRDEVLFPEDPPLNVAVDIVPPARQIFRNRFSTPAVALRANIPFRFAENKRYGEDFLLWNQIVTSGRKAGMVRFPLTYLRKAKYGQSGLSARLWPMFHGELDVYRRLFINGSINGLYCMALYIVSTLAFLKRLFIISIR